MKRGALQTKALIEEVAASIEYGVSSARDGKRNISAPSDSGIGYFDSDKVVGKHRTIGWSIAGGGALLGVFAQSSGLFTLAAFAAGYAIIVAPLIGGIAKGDHKNRERRRLDSTHNHQISDADRRIDAALQLSKDVKEILSQLQRIAPKLSEAPR